MKTILFILAVLFAVPVFAQTYTDTEFIVEGQPVTPQPGAPQPGAPQFGAPQPGGPQPGTPPPGSQPPGTTIVTTTPGSCVPMVIGTTEAPIYVGMSKYHVVEVMGHPTCIDRFRRFAGRQQGIYDEVWTYQTPTGITFVYIKERRVARIEYR